jgi:hypothetical protein
MISYVTSSPVAQEQVPVPAARALVLAREQELVRAPEREPVSVLRLSCILRLRTIMPRRKTGKE